MRCFKCSAILPPDSNFCPHCGEDQGFSEALIQKAIKGDSNATAELYNRTKDNVYHTIQALIHTDEDTINDLVQDTFIKAFQSLKQLQDPNKFRAWVKRIAHNKTIDYLRKEKPIIFSSMTSDDGVEIEFEEERIENLPDLMISQQETSRLLEEIVGELSPDQQMVIGFHFYEGLTIREISETLGVNENTVKSRISYGKKNIAIKIKELEKKGTKLYNLAPIPFLLCLFKKADAQEVSLPDEKILRAIRKNTAPTPMLQGVAGKVVTGVVCASFIGGGAIGILNSNPSHPSNPPINNQPQEEVVVQTPESIYQDILDEYGKAIYAHDAFKKEQPDAFYPYDDETLYPNVQYVMMHNYGLYGGYDGMDYEGFYYVYYDIDGNGVDELLIGYGAQEKTIVDIYCIKDEKPYKLIDEYSLGERSQLYIYPDGTMLCLGSGGALLHGLTTYRFNADGVSLSEETETIEGAFDYEALLQSKSGNQVAIDHSSSYQLDWKPIDIRWDMDKLDDPSAYIGQYINGQSETSGMITIEKKDETTVTVRLETYVDNELKIIFEGTGYAVEDGLVVDVLDKQVKLTLGGYGFYFYVPASLCLEWQLDPSIFNVDYICVTE